MATEASAPVIKPYVESDQREIVRVLFVGVISGILVPLLGILIANFFIKPIFCAASSGGVCVYGGSVTAYHTAEILVGLAAVAVFANWGVFRPLPLVVAVTISLWGLRLALESLNSTSFPEYFTYSILLSGLCYLLFFWLMRLRSFAFSIILSGAAALAIYLAVSS